MPIPPDSGTLVGNTVAHNYSDLLPPGVVRRPLNLLTQGHAPFDNFAPRIGLAWQPFGPNGKFVVRSGFGMFYQTVHGETYLQELNHNPPVAATIRHSGASAAQATFADPYQPRVDLGWDSFLRTPDSALSQAGRRDAGFSRNSPRANLPRLHGTHKCQPRAMWNRG